MSDFEDRGLLDKTIGCSNTTNPDDYADDATWVLTSSFIILTMQSGFGLLEMGSSTIGNEVHILIKNVADVVFGSMAYWLLGFGLSHGKPSIPFMGLGDFAPSAGNDGKESGIKFSNYLFQFSSRRPQPPSYPAALPCARSSVCTASFPSSASWPTQFVRIGIGGMTGG